MENTGTAVNSLKLTKRPLGRILVEGGFISREDLASAIEEQKITGEQLGSILVRTGALGPADLKAALCAQRHLATLEGAVKAVAGDRKRIGELLLQAGRLEAEQLGRALQEQKNSGEKLGAVLVRLGFVTEEEVETVLKFQEHLGAEESNPVALRLGEILVATEHITYEQLRDALARQQTTKKKIGEVLIEAGHVKEHHVQYALAIQHKLVTAALVAALSLTNLSVMSEAQYARLDYVSEAAVVSVSTQVRSHVSLKVLRQPSELVVTNADISRGYIEVNSATLLEIKNNSASGYMIAFEGAGVPFKEVHVTGLGGELVISGTGWFVQPYTGKSAVMFELSYRFILSGDIRPGTYAWPLNVTVSPL